MKREIGLNQTKKNYLGLSIGWAGMRYRWNWDSTGIDCDNAETDGAAAPDDCVGTHTHTTKYQDENPHRQKYT